MQEWPEGVRKAFPPHPRAVPERPWWSKSKTGRGSMLFRTPGEDGIVVDWEKPFNGGRTAQERMGYARVMFPPNAAGNVYHVVYCSTASTSISKFDGASVDFGENYDACMPMDTEADLLKLLERLDAERPLPHPGHRVGQIWANFHGESRVVQAVGRNGAVVFDERTQRISETLVQSLGIGAINIPYELHYLVVDPSCPWVAPWAPAEGK